MLLKHRHDGCNRHDKAKSVTQRLHALAAARDNNWDGGHSDTRCGAGWVTTYGAVNASEYCWYVESSSGCGELATGSGDCLGEEARTECLSAGFRAVRGNCRGTHRGLGVSTGDGDDDGGWSSVDSGDGCPDGGNSSDCH